AYKIVFENANPEPAIEKLQQGSDYENFFLGSDESKWKGNVKNYHQVWLRGVYNGIDYELITAINGVKYNFHVKPGANADDIAMRYDGIDDLGIRDGKLVIKM